jgi:hypothetical protein
MPAEGKTKMPPQVRDLQTLIAEQKQAVLPQQQLIDESIAANANAGQAQEQGLAATKVNEFKAIGQRAQNKGMFFSGFTPNEEAQYTAGTYLPALAQLQATIAQTRSGLVGKKLDLDKGAFDAATGIREGDINRADEWNKTETQRAWQSHQDEVQRQFTADQNAKDRAAAAASASKSKSKASPEEVLTADRNSIAAQLAGATGGDGYVSPGTYKALKNAWTAKGYDSKTFDGYFAPFKNPKNKAY